MDILNARVALRERGFLDVLDLAVRFIVAHASLYVRLTLAVVVPVGVAMTFAVSSLPAALGWTLMILASYFVQIPFTALSGRLVFEKNVRVRDVLRDSLRVLPRALGLRILQTAGIVGAGAVCVIPGLWLGAAWLFATEVLVLEGSRPAATLGRARRLVTRHFGIAAFTLASLAILHIATTIIFDVSGRTIVGELLQITAPDGLIAARGMPTVLASIGFWLFIPFGATARFLVYIDLRTRSEAWDVQTRFAAIAARFAEAST